MAEVAVGKRSTCFGIAILAWIVMLLPARADAQAIAQTLDELRLKVRIDDIVYVRDETGREQRAEIISLTPDLLIVSMGGARREFTDRSTLRIRKRQSDSPWTGGIIGAGVGAGFGVLAASFSEECSHNTASASCAGPILWLTGLGMGVGLGIDALIQGRKVIYEPTRRNARLAVTPLIGKRGVGIRGSLQLK
jgi:hypothetical protein